MKGDEGDLDKRKAYILATVVYEYIATAEPVGSQTLTQKYNLGVSSATVRNEMAELEAGGYLVQPHTSAGRVPSDSGYRTYVDRLMAPEELGPEERRRIRDELHDASRELDEIVDGTTRLLGRLSKNLAFLTKPQQDAQTFKHIQLIWLSPRTGVAVIVTSLGVAAQSLFELGADARPDDLTRFSNALNSRFANRPLRDIVDREIANVVADAGLTEELPSRGCRRRTLGALDRSAGDRRGRRAESARPAGVSRLTQTALDSAHRRRAAHAVRRGCRRDQRGRAQREDRARARQRRTGRSLGRHRALSLRPDRRSACSPSSGRAACRTRGSSLWPPEPPKA